MERIKPILRAILIVGLVASACTAQPTQVQTRVGPTQIVEPVFTGSPDNLPRTQDEVPRVTVEEAKAALESGAAIVVDVRDPAEYEKSHIAGAVSIWLEDIENNPTGLSLDKDQWIITYCGFTEVPKPPELAKRGGAWFQSGSVQVHLGVETEFRPARKAHPAFLVEDLDSLIANIQNAAYEIDTSQPPLDGYKRAHVFDSFGNRIELMEKVL